MQTTTRHSLISLLIVFFAFALAGCNTGTNNPGEGNAPLEDTQAPQPGDTQGLKDSQDQQSGYTDPGGSALPTGELYQIPMDNDYMNPSYWVVDRDGVTVPEDRQFRFLYDILTGEPQCMTLSKTEASKTEDDAVISTETSALFDLEGHLISDWGEFLYSAGFGDFVIRQVIVPEPYYDATPPAEESGLWNFKTKEMHIPDVFLAERLSGDKALLTDSNYLPMGVADGKGARLAGFPMPEQYVSARAWNGYILAANSDYSFLLTPELDQLLAFSSLQESFTSGLLRYTDRIDADGEKRGIITPDGEELYQIPPGESEIYFDENFIVTEYSYNYNSSLNHTALYKIVNLKSGELVCDGIEMVAHDLYAGSSGPRENILVYKEGYLQLFNRVEGLRAEKELPGLVSINILPGGLFCVEANMGNYSFSYMLLGGGLEEIIPLGVYSNITPAMRWNGNDYEYFGKFLCERDSGQSIYLTDFLDTDGSVLIEGLNNIYEVGTDRIAARKGFSAGLMDWAGKWIVERSVFSGLSDD